MADRYIWTDNCCESGVAQCNTDVLNENLMHLKYDVFEKLQEEGLSITDVLNALYPIGAIYIGTMDTCPLAAMGFGTWALKSRGRVLQGSTATQVAGTTIAAGLPNITGAFRLQGTEGSSAVTGAFIAGTKGGSWGEGHENAATNPLMSFDASRSSSIYGNSTTVQPPAYVVNIWERTA